MKIAGDSFSRGMGISIALSSFTRLKEVWRARQEGRIDVALPFVPATWRKDGQPWPVVRPGDAVYLVYEGVTFARAPLLAFRRTPDDLGILRLNVAELEPMGCVFAFQRFPRGWRYWKTDPESERPIHPAALASPDDWFEYAESLAGLAEGDRRLGWKRLPQPKPVRVE